MPAEAVIAALFTNIKEGTILQNSLEDGHQTTCVTSANDNCGITKCQHQSTTLMRCYYTDVRYQVKQGQFIIFWTLTSINSACYFIEVSFLSLYIYMCRDGVGKLRIISLFISEIYPLEIFGAFCQVSPEN